MKLYMTTKKLRTENADNKRQSSSAQTSSTYDHNGFKAQAKDTIDYLLHDESGVGVIEVVLILVVLIALVLIFKDKISSLLRTIFDQIDSSASDVWS